MDKFKKAVHVKLTPSTWAKLSKMVKKRGTDKTKFLSRAIEYIYSNQNELNKIMSHESE